MKPEKLNEDCGCGEKSTGEPRIRPESKDLSEKNIGKMATLFDGRQALVDDSIRNSKGEVIGYVLTNNKGAFRVFKDKIENFSESADMGSLGSMNGQGSVMPPSATHDGSGDQFPSIGFGSNTKKQTAKDKKERKKNQFSNKLMDFNSFSKKMRSFQQDEKSNKK